WFSAMEILPGYSAGCCSGTSRCLGTSRCSGTSGGTVGAQAPVGDVGFVGRGQAGCLADRAVDVSDDAARPAHDVVVIISDPPFEARRAAGRLDAADEPCLGERVQDVVDGLQGDMTDAAAHSGGDRLDAEVVAVPDGLEQCDAGGCHPQAGPAQFLGGGRSGGRRHDAHPNPAKAKLSRKRVTQVETLLTSLIWTDALQPDPGMSYSVIQYRRTAPRPVSTRISSRTPPWCSIVRAEAVLPASQTSSTRSRPRLRASPSIWPSAQVASPRRRADGLMP